MPQISVIVPVYKAEQYLSRCVESILAQTFTDFELILVDDGSPDDCPRLCDAYREKDERIRVIHQKNSGPATARNTGIDWAMENSDSQWISFVDSDDWIHPDMLSFLLQAAEKENVPLSVCGYSIENCFRQPVEKHTFAYQKFDAISFRAAKGRGMENTVVWGKIYSKSLFQNMRFPDGKFAEDVFLTYKLIFLSKELTYVPLPLYSYYDNTTSLTHSTYSVKKLDEIEGYKEQYAFFKKEKQYQEMKKCERNLIHICVLHLRQLKTIHETELYRNLYFYSKRLFIRSVFHHSISLRNDTAVYTFFVPFIAKVYCKVKNFKKAKINES